MIVEKNGRCTNLVPPIVRGRRETVDEDKCLFSFLWWRMVIVIGETAGGFGVFVESGFHDESDYWEDGSRCGLLL